MGQGKVLFLYLEYLLDHISSILRYYSNPKISISRANLLTEGLRDTVFKFARNKQRKIAKAHTMHFQT